MSEIRIGTSGWVYGDWKGRFYPEDLPQTRWLEFYCQTFDTVELNASFYHLPKKKTFEIWHAKTPDNFLFAVKLSSYITRNLKLKDAGESLKYFMEQASGLKEKLGVVLVQLPPNFHLNLERLEEFLNLIKDPYPPFAFEFRHTSWFTKEVYQLLKKHKQTLVIADSTKWPLVEEVTSSLIYARFHGPSSLYDSNYPEEILASWAEKIKTWQASGHAIYAYFNNDHWGYAVQNGLKLRDLITP